MLRMKRAHSQIRDAPGKGTLFASRAFPDGRPPAEQREKPSCNEIDAIEAASLERTALFAHIARFTLDCALQPRVQINPVLFVQTASDTDLARRMAAYNRGVVRPDFLELYRDRARRTPLTLFGTDLDIILDLGEVIKRSSGQLLGSTDTYMEKIVIRIGEKSLQRSHIILFAAGKPRPSEVHTADHIDPRQPMNDSVHNLRWATYSEQTTNSIRSPNVQRSALTVLAHKDGQTREYPSATTAASTLGCKTGAINWAIDARTTLQGWTFSRKNECEGRFLPKHPVYAGFEGTDAQMYRTSKLSPAWRTTSGNRYYECFVDGKKRQINRLALECILGRALQPSEHADHINGDARNWSIGNLWCENQRELWSPCGGAGALGR